MIPPWRPALIFCLLLSVLQGALWAAWQAGDVPDAVLVTWKQGLDRLTLASEAQRLGLDSSAGEVKLHAALHASVGATLKRSTPAIALDQVRLTPGGGAAVDRAVALYQASPLVASAEPDVIMHLALICSGLDDPLYSGGQQWYLTSTAWPQARQAWCSGAIHLVAPVTVAVLDTGINPHPDLAPQLIAGASFVNGEPSTTDLHGHGTFCAGLIGATPANGAGMAGAFFDPSLLHLLPVKVMDQCGEGQAGDVAAGVAWAVQAGAKVISMSLEAPYGTLALENALNDARRHDVMLVAAVGNNNAGTAFPAYYSSVMAVAALDHLDQRAFYSNYGKVDLSAPGGDTTEYCPCMGAAAGCQWQVWSLATDHPGCIYPTPVVPAPTPPPTPVANPTCTNSAGVEGAAGTSFSAPLVAAAAAMLFSQDPTRHVEDVTQRLLQSAATTAAGAGWHSGTGWGKLDYYGALSLQAGGGHGSALKVWNWPNPFDPRRDGLTTLTYLLPAQGPVRLSLYDAGGDLVKRWEPGGSQVYVGMNLLTWDGRNGQGTLVANGSYLLVLESGGDRVTNRIAVLR